jgi:2-oxoisovalerate dehydrogenase E2 component (dihydrolipoyl transacylase)
MPDNEAVPQVFSLPDVGEGLTEAEVVSWLVGPGDSVELNDTLVEVETAKSVVELPSPFAGVVLELHAEAGQTLPVGSPLISIGARAASEPTLVPSDEEPLVLVGTGPREAANRRVHVRPPADEPAPPARGQRASDVSPRRELGVHPTATQDQRVPVKGVRKATADAMVRSAFTAPHASVWATFDVTRTMDWVRRLKQDRRWEGVRVSPLLLVARATALAVERFPDVNARWDEDTLEIVHLGRLNLGVAAATPRGLLVPNVKDAGSMTTRELGEAVQDLVERARQGKLTPEEMSGGTVTLTNVGSLGIEGATPILNPPEALIVAPGAVREAPWVVDGELRVRQVMTLSLSIDHRLIDGQRAGEVLAFLGDVLTDPGATLVRN